MVYRQVYKQLYAASLTREFHERTCGYWFTVTAGSTAHTAFATRAGLDRWLTERDLLLESELPDAGTSGFARIIGEYQAASHGEPLVGGSMGEGGFYALRPVAVTMAMSNGQYTLALITEEDGMRVINTLNPNVRTRVVFNRARAGEFMR